MMFRRSFGVTAWAVALAAALVMASSGPAGAVPSDTGQAQTTSACRVQAANLPVRVGPGAAFPIVTSLLQGATVRGVSFVRTGVPNGSWVEVEITPGVSSGFVAADAQSVICQPAVTLLPPGQAPPAPGQTRQRISRTPVDGGDLSTNPVVRGPANVNNGQYIILPGVDQGQVNDVIKANGGTIRFGDAFGFGVEPLDRRAGQTIGSGIQQVDFKLTYFDEDQGEDLTAYQTTEFNAPYCLFSDENGQCNVFRFSKMGYKWPDTRFGKGLPRPGQDTQYTAIVTIVPKRGDPIVWRWNFQMSGRAVEFP
jgi:hypothetical protein